MSRGTGDYSRLSLDVPTEFAEQAMQMLGGLGIGRNLSVYPIRSNPMPPDGPQLFTMVEDPDKERLIPAIQRPHIREFVAQTGLAHLGVGERLISGLWSRGPSAAKYPKDVQRYRLRPTVITDRLGKVTALKATETPRLYRLLKYGEVDIMGVGDTTIDFVGELSEAVQAELARL
jgi:hypothetical protein